MGLQQKLYAGLVAAGVAFTAGCTSVEVGPGTEKLNIVVRKDVFLPFSFGKRLSFAYKQEGECNLHVTKENSLAAVFYSDDKCDGTVDYLSTDQGARTNVVKRDQHPDEIFWYGVDQKYEQAKEEMNREAGVFLWRQTEQWKAAKKDLQAILQEL